MGRRNSPPMAYTNCRAACVQRLKRLEAELPRSAEVKP
jgi:hypothetical protein